MPKNLDTENIKLDFLDWTELKIRLDLIATNNVFFKERDIWWTSLGKNIGSEQDGKNENFTRPILIIKKFNQETFLGLPTSTKIKNSKYYYIFEKDCKKYTVNLSQLRLLSNKRLLKKMWRLDKKDFQNIKEKLKDFFI